MSIILRKLIFIIVLMQASLTAAKVSHLQSAQQHIIAKDQMRARQDLFTALNENPDDNLIFESASSLQRLIPQADRVEVSGDKNSSVYLSLRYRWSDRNERSVELITSLPDQDIQKIVLLTPGQNKVVLEPGNEKILNQDSYEMPHKDRHSLRSGLYTLQISHEDGSKQSLKWIMRIQGVQAHAPQLDWPLNETSFDTDKLRGQWKTYRSEHFEPGDGLHLTTAMLRTDSSSGIIWDNHVALNEEDLSEFHEFQVSSDDKRTLLQLTGGAPLNWVFQFSEIKRMGPLVMQIDNFVSRQIELTHPEYPGS